MYFFRDPERNIPDEKNAILSPADGKIVRIEKIDSVPFLENTAHRIDIFLSLFDVHVNRIPVSGKVICLDYRKGEFYPAYLPKASERNERMNIGIESDTIKIMLNQIAGTVARRIVCNLSENQNVQSGERFGLIKFGSCVQVFIPDNIPLLVKTGSRVRAGETILGVI